MNDNFNNGGFDPVNGNDGGFTPNTPNEPQSAPDNVVNGGAENNAAAENSSEPLNAEIVTENETHSAGTAYTPPTGNTARPPFNGANSYQPPTGGNTPPVYQPIYHTQNFTPPVNHYNAANGQNAFQNPKKSDNKKGLKVFCVIMVVIIMLSFGIGMGYLAGKNNDLKSDTGSNDLSLGGNVEIQQGTVPEREGITPDENGKYTADQVAKLVSDSVVNITVYSSQGQASSVASGVIIDKSGYILSNDHIYSNVPNAKFVITLNNGNSYNAVYVAGDTRSDLCVLKMSCDEEVTPATFADSSKLASGDDVIAIGSPYGLSGTVTKGIISAPSRRISISGSDSSGSTANYSMRVIQTDTAINSGNSGGALANMYGQIVGISSSKIVANGYEGLCFAIPSNDALKYATSLIENKTVKGRAKLGISYLEVSSATSVMTGAPSGLQIQDISLDSTLYSSGLSKGDIITEIDGEKITSADVALDIIDSKQAGDSIKITAYIASSKSYKTVTTKLLEDSSTSSYSTEEQPETTSAFSIWGK